jgi:hypothetical protein
MVKRNEMPQAFGIDTLELAVQNIKAVQALLDTINGDAEITATLYIDGCTVGVVEVQDGFPVFVANADWAGYVPRPMGE